MKKRFEIKIGEDLREKPIDLKEFLEELVALEQEILLTVDVKEKAIKLSKAGVSYRIIGDLTRSQKRLKEASILLEANGFKRLMIINQIRIGQTLQFRNKHVQADAVFTNLEKELLAKQVDMDLLDFVYQHKGKNLLEDGKTVKAMECFKKALELRKKKGDQALIDSTMLAIRFIEEER